jgi:hypothetical protein
MAIVAALKGLGFTADLIFERKGIFTVKIKTAKGWTYDRFGTEADVTAWARGKEPG